MFFVLSVELFMLTRILGLNIYKRSLRDLAGLELTINVVLVDYTMFLGRSKKDLPSIFRYVD